MKEFKGTNEKWELNDKLMVKIFKDDPLKTSIICQVFGNSFEDKANAKLIASAPKLLKALIDIVSQIENEHVSEYMDEYAEQAKQVINKAL